MKKGKSSVEQEQGQLLSGQRTGVIVRNWYDGSAMADNRHLDIEGNNIKWQLNSSLSHYY